MKTNKTIYVSGSLAYDEIMDFPDQFKNFFQADKLHQINVSFVVDRLEKQLGGTATNIAYNLSLFLKKNIVVQGAAGKDHGALTSFFKARRISPSLIHIDNKLYTSTGKVITDKSDNQIWGFYYGAAAKAGKKLLPKTASKDDIVILSANHPNGFLAIQKQVIKQKLTCLYDPGMSLTWISDADLQKGVNGATWIVGNDYEISSIYKRLKTSEQKLVDAGKIVITTLGEKGVKYRDARQTITVSGYSSKKVVDPTGAGDAWRGGFVAGLAQNKSIEYCLKLGNAVASFAVESYGTVNHKPTITKVTSRMRTLRSNIINSSK